MVKMKSMPNIFLYMLCLWFFSGYRKKDSIAIITYSGNGLVGQGSFAISTTEIHILEVTLNKINPPVR
jgi:hypothetical protein